MWIVFALLAALCAGASVVLSKAGLKNLDSTVAFAIQSVMIVLITWTAVVTQKAPLSLQEIDRRTWLFLLGAGVATTLSSLLTFRALKLGEASLVTSVERVSLVFAVFFSVVFLKERLSWQLVAGAVLMIGGALLIGFSQQSSD
ncbi:EamA family transporter [Arundinibacter roseus]|uniref:EamA family transporter n=1 Tax=Arundinibacter roseus TaxID=2070510 RepID=A0A4R4KBP1_9BACT|nr:EamA family transporter [Arundinibacter roseus]TDB64172.1 EamA family transporter [Arundinibacter roseus]